MMPDRIKVQPPPCYKHFRPRQLVLRRITASQPFIVASLVLKFPNQSHAFNILSMEKMLHKWTLKSNPT